MSKYPQELITIIACLKKFPGVGKRSAERFAFALLDWKVDDRKAFAKLIDTLDQTILYCDICGCILCEKQCLFCTTGSRDTDMLCVVSSPKEVFAIEETHSFKGLYHVFGPLLSPLDGVMPEDAQIKALRKRVIDQGVQEIVLAFDSTLEGDATTLYLQEELKNCATHISKLALGMPMGSSLDFLDESTLSFALKGRQKL